MSDTPDASDHQKKTKRAKKVKPFTPQPSLGHNFEISSVSFAELKIRERMAYALLSALALALVLSAIYGIHVGEFSGLQEVWNYSSAILGLVVGYFFRSLKP